MGKISGYTQIVTSEISQAVEIPVTDPNNVSMASTGTTNKMTVGQLGAFVTGATVTVPPPTGATATDTPAVTAAIASLASALSFGPATLLLADGTYVIDSNSAVFRSLSNFAVRSAGRTIIQQAPNRSGLANNTSGDLLVIADCADFSVEGVTIDGRRDVVAPITPLTASASSGQPSVTVAAGNGSRYQAGQYLCVMGGVGSSDQNTSDGFKVGFGGIGLQIASITAGGGAGGGDLITFTTNLAHSYTQTGGTALSDGWGPYAWTTDYLTPYQAAPANSVAGRTLSGEDQQCGLHLLNCQRFTILDCTSRNVWESPFKLGTGFASSSLTDGCSQGAVTNCTGYHGYDQGVSIWVGDHIAVTGCVMNAAGWAGVCMTAGDYCTVTGNQVLNSVYQVPGGLGEGSGIVTEGGLRNVIGGNVISGVYEDGVRIDSSPLTWGLPGTNPSLSAFVPAQTAAGTSIQVSSTTGLQVGAPYSLLDFTRTEAVVVASVIDGTHLTFAQATKFSHGTTTLLTVRMAQENVVQGNAIYGPQTGNGVTCLQGVRSVIKNNTITGWAGGNGIVLDYNTLGSGYTGGFGTHIEGNVIGGGANACIRATWLAGLLIRGNRLYGPSSGSGYGLRLAGIYDSLIEGNHVSDFENGPGIYMQSGGPSSAPCVRTTVKGNVVRAVSAEGIIVLSGTSAAADSLVITGNSVASCGGHAGINLRGVTNSTISDNVSNANASDGIRLEANGSVNCTGNRVTGNTCRDDGSGINVTTGAGQTQQYGIRELTGSNGNVYTGNEVDSNAVTQLTTVGAGTSSYANVISGVVVGAPGVVNYGGIFGDGSDGPAVLNGTNTVPWATLSGSTYTMSRDCFLTSLSISSGITVVNGSTAGGRWRIFCAGPVTSAGAINANGANATSATGATGLGGGTLDGSGNGGNGTTGSGTAGAGPSNGALVGVGAGGAGGAGSTGSAGSGGAVNSSNTNNWLRLPTTLTSAVVGVSANTKMLSGAPGGGGGSGDGTNSGGGGGAGGGCIGIAAWSFVNTGTISAAGGNGFTPAAGNCGGGGGGGGGLILVLTLSAWTAGTTSVAGGTAGSGVGTGAVGTAGTAGNVLNLIVQ